jgi:hypothetical protein
VNKSFIKKASLAAMAGLLPISASAGEVSISGWVNEGVVWYDDGTSSDMVQASENGATLGTRMTFSGTQELPSGLNAGFEIILEPQSAFDGLGFASTGGLAGSGDQNGHAIAVLGNSVNVSGGFGKVTVGLQSMPTDNIAVLEDPSLTLWSAISPVFVGNGAVIQGVTGAKTTWGSFLTCGGIGAPIGIDCNGVYRQGVRYDLPAFGPVTVAIGWSNDDIYDINAKYKGELAGMKAQLALGYAMIAPAGGNNYGGTDVDNFQMQAGLMDPGTGIFGSIAYQHEEMDGTPAGQNDSTDAWWTKVGIKKGFNSLGDTSISFNYGQYNDQFGVDAAAEGITGSEVERIGFEVNQYFGSAFILYGVYEMLDLEVDGAAGALYGGADELDTFRLGATYFF